MSQAHDPQVTSEALLLAEYSELKQEQRARISTRDNLIYATLTASAAVITATIATNGVELLLLLPLAILLLGWTYLANDHKVSALGDHIRDEIAPRLAAAARDQHAFTWETTHRTDARRSSRKAIQCAVDLALFAGAPFVALMTFWVLGTGGWLVTASIVEALAVAGLATEIIRYARS